MKDLILIGAHCPDDEREKYLSHLVDQLQNIKDDFDILICSHIPIPKYITKKVDFVFYDKNNDLISDLDYMNQPWFSPFEGLTILSTLISETSTYLSVYRLLISGLGIAKIYGYEKVHYIEYDTQMNDLNEIKVHSQLLNDYDWVAIKKEERGYELNIDWPIGNFQSFKIKSVDRLFTEFNRNELLNILLKSPNKTNEKITYDIMTLNSNKPYLRNYDTELSNKNIFNLSRNTKRDNLNYWALPYYDTKKDIVNVIVWNNKDDDPIQVIFIINNERIIKFDSIKKFEWSIKEVGDINSINSITTIINGKLKNNLVFNGESRIKFKETSYTNYKN